MQAPPVHNNSGTNSTPCFFLTNSIEQNDLTAASQPGSAADDVQWDPAAPPFYNQLNTSYIVATATDSMPPPPTENNRGNLVRPMLNFFTDARFFAPQQ